MYSSSAEKSKMAEQRTKYRLQLSYPWSKGLVSCTELVGKQEENKGRKAVTALYFGGPAWK